MARPSIATVVLLLVSAAVTWAEPRLERHAPHVWNVTQTEATVAWFTNDDGRDSVLEYGPTTAYGTVVRPASRPWPLLESGPRLHHHVAVLRGLEPNTRYYYRIVAAGQAIAPGKDDSDEDYHVLTARRPDDHSPFTFLVMGDGGEGNKYQRAMAYHMERSSFEFVLHTGDVVYDRGTDAEWQLNYYPIYRNMIRNRPWFLSPGNHEYLDAPAFRILHDRAGRPRLLRPEEYAAAPKGDSEPLVFRPQARGSATGYFENAILPDQPGGERYYSFDWGPVHIVVLDSNRSFTPGRPGDAQYQWLVEDLAASNAPWKVVCFHHPLTSIGKPAYVHSAESATQLRKDWHGVFERYGVDVVFTGHDHTYQRTHPVVIDPQTGELSRDDDRGVVHIITGGGGGGLSDRSIDPPAWHTGVFHKRHHFLLVTVDGRSMEIRAVADADINTPGVTERQGVGGEAELLDTVRIQRRNRR